MVKYKHGSKIRCKDCEYAPDINDGRGCKASDGEFGECLIAVSLAWKQKADKLMKGK